MNTIFTTDSNAMIKKIRDQIHKVLDPLIPAGSVCALIDFPHHANVGDSAIWLGETTYLKQRKCKICYICDWTNYNHQTLAELIGKNIILFHGGGNFGDLYLAHQKLRERVVKEFPDNRIILFPQSIFFSDFEQLENSQKIFSAHQDFHIIVRDKSSFNFAKEHYSNPVYLCPDTALMLNLKPLKNCFKSTNLVILSRTDKEKASFFNSEELLLQKHLSTDWMDESEPKYRWLYDWSHLRLSWDSKVPPSILGYLSFLSANAIAKERLERGLNILGQGNFVITDRLHALILSWLGKTPVNFVDNKYGKLSSFVDTWLTDIGNIQKCSTFTEAVHSAVKCINSDQY